MPEDGSRRRAGRRSRLDKARFYSIALGSTTECGAAWELLRRQQAVDAATYHSGRSLIVRVAQMLSRLERSMRA